MKKLLYICALLLLLLHIPVFLRVITEKKPIWSSNEVGDTIVMAVRPNTNDFYLYRSEVVGFHLELIQAYAYTNQYTCQIYWESEEDKRWQKLLNGKITIMVCNPEDSTLNSLRQEHKVFHSTPLENYANTVWVVNKKNRHLLAEINSWISYYRTTPEYELKWLKYFVSRNPEQIQQQTELSPYDKLIKLHAKRIEWDWRLLASMIYQESRFRPEAESHRGAYGLMQIMPTTAEHYRLGNITAPEDNIKGGAYILSSLQKETGSDTISFYDNICFLLAAYNAGANRVSQCRYFAELMGKDPYKWKEVASVIPLMKHSVYYENIDNIYRFKGAETLNYVEKIMERFEFYKILLPD
ncbi:MAG: transglycosylase SLT domain-containing protein [Bacteroidales bacterium]|nr:transglycosylase SLT domain-containing protein [Bacteroidales bacterium]